MFDRQDREVSALKALTLEEFKDHFEKLLFNENTTRRLDYQLTSVKHVAVQSEWAQKLNEVSE